MADIYGLFGYPVEHSWSPFIHEAFARQTGQHMAYGLHESTPERFPDDLRDFFRDGGKGTNITLPHKQAAAGLVDELTARARRADAVNTIARVDAGLLGDNTDGAGLVADLGSNLGLTLAGARILLLGSGGAARGALGPLLEFGPRSLVISNRTLQRAVELAQQFAEHGPVSACRFSDVGSEPFDLILNATSASLRGDVPEIQAGAVDGSSFCYDMSYGIGDTAFTRWAKRQGAGACAQGWGMLVEQAAESFYLWRGIRPETATVLEALRRRAEAPRRSRS